MATAEAVAVATVAAVAVATVATVVVAAVAAVAEVGSRQHRICCTRCNCQTGRTSVTMARDDLDTKIGRAAAAPARAPQ